MMRFASLGSGSQGNSLVVEVGQTRVMLDCGFGINETVLRLSRLKLAPQQISALVVTHEHSDHIGGAVRLARKFGMPVWVTCGTASVFREEFSSLPQVCYFEVHQRFSVGNIELEPFPVPHDAREPAQFVFGNGARRLGVITDTGSSTSHIENVLNCCDALVLECNHDLEMLKNGAYPAPLKERIAGRFGHLSNDDAAKLLAALDRHRLQHLIAAHLSQNNNTPQLAKAALARVMNCDPEWVGIADQQNGFAWREIA
ncbi:MAG TPA: MBL fold metallo-hydrolase [Burkholderiales bacterium]|nr:MBL fold metallo-hydrolase [Burkholderiales bacterium]